MLSLMVYSHSQLKYTYQQFGYFEAFENALSGLHCAQVKINASTYNAEGHNEALFNSDSSKDGQPGAGFLVHSNDFADPPGEFYVKVNRIDDDWYELLAYGFRGMGTSDEVKVLIKLRVCEHDFFSRYGLFAENGWVVIDDTNHWYGRVHVNSYIGFRNRMDSPQETLTGFDWEGNYHENRVWDKGTRFYEQVTSTQSPRDYPWWERGGCEDAWFAVSPDFNAQRMEFPEAALLADMGAEARKGASVVYSDQYGRVYVGPYGISIISKGDTELHSYIRFINGSGENRKVRITVKRDGDTWWETGESGIELPQGSDFIIHSEDDIKELEGELNGRVTVVCEGEVLISDDIWYEDDSDNRAVIYDSSNPGGDNFHLNSNYTGNSCLGVIAASNVYLVNNNGYARDDKDLILCGVFAAGVGGDDMNGSFSWLPADEYRNGIGGTEHTMRDLRVYGAMLSDGNSATELAHWKGYTLESGSDYYGYNSSIFRYDFNLLNSPPPSYMQINMPKYSGWQIIR